jgi:hypothetical protein
MRASKSSPTSKKLQASFPVACNFFEVGDDFDALIVDGRSPLMNRVSDEGRLATIIYALDSRSINGHIKRGEWLVKSGIHINYDELLEEFSNISLFIIKNKFNKP